MKLPPELDHEITRVDFSLPDATRPGVVLDGILQSKKLKPPHEALRESGLQGALGLTTTEAENAFALSVVESGGIDHNVVSREKARALKRNGLVEVTSRGTFKGGLRRRRRMAAGFRFSHRRRIGQTSRTAGRIESLTRMRALE